MNIGRMRHLFPQFGLLGAGFSLNSSRLHCDAGDNVDKNSIFQFDIVDIYGQAVTKDRMRGKGAFLIVNTACE
jgi:hypothetical protein